MPSTVMGASLACGKAQPVPFLEADSPWEMVWGQRMDG